MREKSKKTKWIVLVVLAVIVAGIIIGRGWIMVAVREYLTAKRLNPVVNNVPEGTTYLDFSTIAEENERLKGKASDISGMSRYDKAKAGLDISDQSDTDGDGLTDKDEIEKYGTDPLKCSTAGDLYTDSYKIKNNMNPLESYEYDGNTTICDDNGFITLFAKTPYDLGEGINITSRITPVSTGAEVYDCTEEAKAEIEGSSGIHVHYCVSDCFYRAYKVVGYDGDRIDIDIEEIADDLGKEAKTLSIEVYAKQNGVQIKEKRDAGIITLSISDENHDDGSPFNIYEIYIVDSMRVKAANAVKNTKDITNGESDAVPSKTYQDNAGLIVICPPATVFFRQPPRIYCANDATEAEKEVLLNEATRLYQSIFYEPIWVERPVCDESYLTFVSRKKIEYYNELCYKILGLNNNVHYLGTADVDGRFLLLGFESFGDFYEDRLIAMREEEIAREKKAAKKDIFFFNDEFPFDNFDSPYTGGGVCMGMARVAAEVYNDESVQISSANLYSEEAFLESTGYEVSFDIKDERCGEWTQTFFDRYLGDYKFGGELKVEDEDEDEVMKMLSWYWADGNLKMNQQNDMAAAYINLPQKHAIAWETVERAAAELDKGHVLLCGFNINNRSNRGHMVNLVGYDRIDESYLYRENKELGIEGGISFRVYDNNFHNQFGSLNCYKFTYPNGRSIMLYEYNAPSSGNEKPQNYGSQFLGNIDDRFLDSALSTNGFIGGFHEIFFIIMTEDLNMLNVPY